MKKYLQSGVIFIVIAALLWSMDGLLRRSLYSVNSFVVVFWEHLLGLALLAPFAKNIISDFKSFSRKEMGASLTVALFSGLLGTYFYTAALAKVGYIPFSVVVLLQQLQPIWGIITAKTVLKEKLDKGFLQWAGIAIAAAYLVSFPDLKVSFSTDNQHLVAALMALAAGIVWGSTTSFSKIVLKKTSVVNATTLRFFFTTIFAGIAILLTGSIAQTFPLASDQWTKLIAITFSTGMFAMLIYYFGLKKTPARVSNIAELVWPISAIVIDYFTFRNAISVTQMIGMVLILTAIYHVSKYRK